MMHGRWASLYLLLDRMRVTCVFFPPTAAETFITQFNVFATFCLTLQEFFCTIGH